MKPRKPHFEIELPVCGDWESMNTAGDTRRFHPGTALRCNPKRFPSLTRVDAYAAANLTGRKYRVVKQTPPELVGETYAWHTEIIRTTEPTETP
jgi:hypothetical protein